MRVALLATAFLGACGGARSLPERTGSVPPELGKTITQEQIAASGAKTAWELDSPQGAMRRKKPDSRRLGGTRISITAPGAASILSD